MIRDAKNGDIVEVDLRAAHLGLPIKEYYGDNNPVGVIVGKTTGAHRYYQVELDIPSDAQYLFRNSAPVVACKASWLNKVEEKIHVPCEISINKII